MIDVVISKLQTKDLYGWFKKRVRDSGHDHIDHHKQNLNDVESGHDTFYMILNPM